MVTLPTDLDERVVVALTLYAEARGESVPRDPGHIGYQAVGAVLLTRSDIADDYANRHRGTPHPLFGDGSLGSACLVPMQFSCWNEGDPQRSALLKLADQPLGSDALYDLALSYADRLLSDQSETWDDPTESATHYLTKDAYDRAGPSHWSRSPRMFHTVDILHHKFFRQT